VTKLFKFNHLHLPACEDGTDSVPKRRHIKFRLRGIIQKKTYENLNLVILHLPAYEYGTECSETSAHKIQTPGCYPEENVQHTEYGESLKSRRFFLFARPLQKEQIDCSEISARHLVHTAYDDGTVDVQQHQHIKFRRRGITRKKNTTIFKQFTFC
jgi:hypothetical protein